MNSFITDDDPKICAKNLDNKRLGKQRLECVQMLNAMNNPYNKGWINHPCTKMWTNHQLSLKYYTNCMIDEWISRGFKNTMEKFIEYDEKMPWWFYSKILQNSHKASLLRKNKSFYSNIFNENDLIDYMDYSYLWISDLSPEQLYILQNNENNMNISLLAKKIE